MEGLGDGANLNLQWDSVYSLRPWKSTSKQENEIQPGEGGLMGALEGVPLPGVEVAYEYTTQGKVIRGTVKTDAKGEFALEVPVGATVKLTARGETKTVTVVAGKPAGVAFGHQGHDPTKDQPLDPTQLPRSDF